MRESAHTFFPAAGGGDPRPLVAILESAASTPPSVPIAASIAVQVSGTHEVQMAQAQSAMAPTPQPGATLTMVEVPGLLATVLWDRWEAYSGRLQECQDQCSEVSIHELRVATRRMLSQLALVDRVQPNESLRSARRTLKRRLKALGELRDLHVLTSFLGRQSSRYPELLLVRKSLTRRSRRMVKATEAIVGGLGTTKLGI